MKEKQYMMNHILRAKKKLLERFETKQRTLRQHIKDLNKKRKRARHEISQASFQCGLLDKPNLMLDYDRTVEIANEQKALNEALKQTVKRLENKITLLENRCAKKKCSAKVVKKFH